MITPRLSTDITYDSTVGINPSLLPSPFSLLPADRAPSLRNFPFGQPSPSYGLYLERAKPIQKTNKQKIDAMTRILNACKGPILKDVFPILVSLQKEISVLRLALCI